MHQYVLPENGANHLVLSDCWAALIGVLSESQRHRYGYQLSPQAQPPLGAWKQFMITLNRSSSN